MSVTNWSRFDSHIDPLPNGCWQWRGCMHSEGYGVYGKSPKYAHRMSYERARGPIAAGLQIDHLCKDRACVNPDHLEAVTQSVNILRGDSPGALSVRTGRCGRGHEWTPENTYVRKDGGGRQCRACARENLRNLHRRRKEIAA